MLEDDSKQQIKNLFKKDEKILWEGKPTQQSPSASKFIKGLLYIFLQFFLISFFIIFYLLADRQGPGFQFIYSPEFIIILTLIFSAVLLNIIMYPLRIHFLSKKALYIITNLNVYIKIENEIKSLELEKINDLDNETKWYDRTFQENIGTVSFKYTESSDSTDNNLNKVYYLESIPNYIDVFNILEKECSSKNSAYRKRLDTKSWRQLKSTKETLSSNEEFLWFDSESYRYNSLKSCLKILILIITLPFLVTFLVMLVFYAYKDFFINPLTSINIAQVVLWLLLTITLIYIFYKIFLFARKADYRVGSLGITKKRLIFTTHRGDNFSFYYMPFMMDILDITKLQTLNIKKGNFSKYSISGTFYGYIFSKKSEKILLDSVDVFLDEKGLEILTNLIKEQAPNAQIKL